MKKYIFSALSILVSLQITGCMLPGMNPYSSISNPYNDMARKQQEDTALMQQRKKLSEAFMSSPDTDAWHEQRLKMSQAMGDRIFDKDFGRVFDSLVLALSSLELKVNNMERASGYIQASGISFPPTEAKAMSRQAANDWCAQKGFDANILDKEYHNPYMAGLGGDTRTVTLATMSAQYSKDLRGLTFQLIKMGNDQTKVKLRFSDVYYPPEMEAYYKMVWQSVDKQIFVDKNVEGAVEQRK